MKNWFTNRLIRGRILAVMPFFSTLLFSPFLLSAQEKGEGAQVAPKPTEVVKRPLDHESYDRWNRIQGQKLSDDGNWLFYTLRPGKGDPRLFVKNRDSSSPIELEKGSNLQFYRGNRLVFLETLELKKEEVAQEEPKKENNEPQEEKKEEKKKDEKKKPETKKQLVMISLDHLLPSANKIDGSARRVLADNVSSFTLSKEGPSWIAYRVKAAKKEDEKKEEGEKKEKQTEEPGEKKGEAKDTKDDPKAKRSFGSPLHLLHAPSGKTITIDSVKSFRFSDDGNSIFYIVTSEKEETDGIYRLELETQKTTPLLQGAGDYKGLVLHKNGKQAAFFSNKESFSSEEKKQLLYYWKKGLPQASSILTDSIPEGEKLVDSRVTFSEKGNRLFFFTTKVQEKKKETKKKSKVQVDIWHWEDPTLQPAQLLNKNRATEPRFQHLLELGSGKVTRLGNERNNRFTLSKGGDGNYGLATYNKPYQILSSWDSPGYSDIYLLNVATGKESLLFQKHRGRLTFSPTGKYLFWWDGQEKAWKAMRTGTNKVVNLSQKIPHPVYRETSDQPRLPGSHGNAGWTENDGALLIYDNHDIWAVSPENAWAPHCITDGYGRKNDLRFRYVKVDPEKKSIGESDELLLSAFNVQTKASGFYTDQYSGSGLPRKIVMKNERLSNPTKATKGDVYLFTRQTFRDFPDLWTSNLNFENLQRQTTANPQQEEYTWGTEELFEWVSNNGEKLQGILIKPDNFDPKKKYPMMVYFYERNSDGLHRYVTPSAGSSINYSFYVSRGYVLFVPDIPYTIGHPGQSAENAILPGIAAIANNGFIDLEKIGVQGHSWGGYQISHLVTRTNIFAAAEAGAPVSNMTSAYGGIRWSSGMSRMFQYERTQSRIGGTLWNAQQKYIENSPIFNVDQITTPLLILHNDKDGAVPWYQGIELFVAMRRLGKPAWLFNYNGEEHGLRKDHNKRDWTIRMQQFFDHYLQEAPAPVWLIEGVPATKKGIDLGLDLLPNKKSDK